MYLAQLLEESGQMKKAIDILIRGLSDDAEPHDKLQEYYNSKKKKLKAKYGFNTKNLGNINFMGSDEPGFQFEEIRAVRKCWFFFVF